MMLRGIARTTVASGLRVRCMSTGLPLVNALLLKPGMKIEVKGARQEVVRVNTVKGTSQMKTTYTLSLREGKGGKRQEMKLRTTDQFQLLEEVTSVKGQAHAVVQEQQEEVAWDSKEAYQFLWRDGDRVHLQHADTMEQVEVLAALVAAVDDLEGGEDMVVYSFKGEHVKAALA